MTMDSWTIFLLAVFFIFLLASIVLKGGAATFASLWAMLTLCAFGLLYFAAPPSAEVPAPKEIKINQAEALVLFNLSGNEFQREIDWALKKAAQGDNAAKDRFALLNSIAKHKEQCFEDFISSQ